MQNMNLALLGINSENVAPDLTGETFEGNARKIGKAGEINPLILTCVSPPESHLGNFSDFEYEANMTLDEAIESLKKVPIVIIRSVQGSLSLINPALSFTIDENRREITVTAFANDNGGSINFSDYGIRYRGAAE